MSHRVTVTFPGRTPPLVVRKIEHLRVRAGLSRTEFEHRAHLAHYRLYHWLSRSGEPRSDQILPIAQVLGVSAEALLDDHVGVDDLPRPRAG